MEDEMHVALECPRYKRIQQHYAFQPLFPNLHGRDMNTRLHNLMNNKDQFKLSHFIFTVLRRRDELVSQLAQPHDMWDSSDEDSEVDIDGDSR